MTQSEIELGVYRFADGHLNHSTTRSDRVYCKYVVRFFKTSYFQKTCLITTLLTTALT